MTLKDMLSLKMSLKNSKIKAVNLIFYLMISINFGGT